MKTKNEFDLFLDKLKEELIAPEIESIILEKFSVPPPHLLEPKHIWQEKIRQNLTDVVSGQAIMDKTVAGFNAIVKDLSHHAPAELEQISEEWSQYVENWINQAKGELEKENVELSQETLSLFYEAGNRYFTHKDYKSASDVFFALSGINPQFYNTWLALGLSEFHLENWQGALSSFSMASITHLEAPHPYLYSAECCLKLCQKEEAKIYLQLAEEAGAKEHMEKKEDFLSSIKRLQQLAK